ncbi:sperm-associated antigen 1 [Ceratitis capitata]|uniref:Sperm-associated antigen 1 n=1 Tax=Ceratitis capitata TaxID=7213 RepID=W8BHV6_CERCA|nr:sperm-associated antigen 1 [Ceratitis capitata]
MEGREAKRKLIEKFEIPINHLDFAYIGDCADAREMEKIVQILRSGEEGYFPDLTACAENKLRELKPNSRLFRYEEKLQGREALSSHEWKPIFDWTNNIKAKDSVLATAAEKMAQIELGVPPVRKSGTIKQTDEKKEPQNIEASTEATKTAEESTGKPIKSTDYRKWDKYDADEECLRMELAEERVKEDVERKNRLNKQKSKLQTLNEFPGDGPLSEEMTSKLTEVERERIAEDYRLRGNDYFRAKEYENAINEYTRSITVCGSKAAAAYNNRAAAKIKLKRYSEAIKDCEQCLQIEPENLKARLRLADATNANGERQESYILYMKVLELEPNNAAALKAIEDLKNTLGELPPLTATRLQIVEDSPNKIGKQEKKREFNAKTVEKLIGENNEMKKSDKKESTSIAATNPPRTNKPKDYDLSDLIKPNRLVKNKFVNAAAALSNMKSAKVAKQKPPAAAVETSASPGVSPELRLPNDDAKTGGKILIQEI